MQDIKDLDREITLIEWDLQYIKDTDVRKLKFEKLQQYKHQRDQIQNHTAMLWEVQQYGKKEKNSSSSRKESGSC